ncbi:hypothetical protein EJB05_43464, partial [Eragrostis curvula]
MAEIAILLVVKKISIAMAEETLKFAIPLLANKSVLAAALPNDMKLIKNELELIHAFLKGIGRKIWNDEVIETWVGQVRRLAFDMEDIVDQFIYVVGNHTHKGSWWNHIKKIFKKPEFLFTIDKIATEVKRINQELKQLAESRDRWTKPLDRTTDFPSAGYETEQELYLPGHICSFCDDELVGIETNRQILIDLLHSGDRLQRIITVWGMGGIGKSILVNHVYKNEASKFDCHAWVSISQSYTLGDIWKMLLTDLIGKDKSEFDPGRMNSSELRVELKKIMYERRYLIILDDVWTAKVLFDIRDVLVDNGLKSRIIITTRMEEVASVAEDGCKIKIEPLDDRDAWLLFCRKAFPSNKNHICPPDLHVCARDIVEKCDGLPLALVAVGGLLSFRPRNDKEWRLFYNQLIWELHNNVNLNRVEKILNLSYKYLRDYLKNCFLYCAMFPEDYLIHRKRLIRLWIAEGFIEQKGRCRLEDVAEGYLGELIRRSMLQVAKRNSFDRVGLDSRRVSVLQCSKGIPSSIDSCRLRTFITFETSLALSSCYSSIYSKSKYLAVLDLSGLPIQTIPNSVGELFNLRFLCLDNTKVKELPNSITKLQNLQTLSLESTQLLNFPRGLSKLKKLRYLYALRLHDVTRSNFFSWDAVEPFKGLWNLNELQTLGSIKASEGLVAELGNLSQLRRLSICDVSYGVAGDHQPRRAPAPAGAAGAGQSAGQVPVRAVQVHRQGRFLPLRLVVVRVPRPRHLRVVPATLSYFGHPEHPLALEKGTGSCRLCELCINGIYYACACRLSLHPVCATLPAATISPLHPQHLVTLVPTKADVVTKCAVCRFRCDTMGGWHYECSPCGFRLHPWCLLGDAENNAPLCIRGPGGHFGEYD